MDLKHQQNVVILNYLIAPTPLFKVNAEKTSDTVS